MFVVQLGAHGHADTSYVNAVDPVPRMVASGASALLVEPQPHFAHILRHKYADNPAVRILNQAICSGNITSANLYSVQTDNAESFGTLRADGRCANKTINPGSSSDWVTEIASLSRQQVLKQAYLFSNSPRQCRACAKSLGHSLPSDCMRDLIQNNLRTTLVPCLKWNSALLPGRAVSLLMVDVEGHEESVINSFPFATNPVSSVKFEAKHLNKRAINRISDKLIREGFVLKYTGEDQMWTRTVSDY